ncbi:MAG: hypothetical protein JWL83_4026 [Actinomycetia bacterium]|nr:hypothetical protein [Actinomycetes bacterium]
MIAKRLLALLVAAAMVLGATVLRSSVFDKKNNGTTSAKGVARLACATELADACNAIERASGGHVQVIIEAAGDTAQRIVSAPDATAVGIDGWLTLAPWPQIVSERRQRAGDPSVFGTVSARVARSALVIAVRRDREQLLAKRCAGAITWRCIGTVAGKSFADLGAPTVGGTVQPAHPEPVHSGSGLLVLGQAVASYLATPQRPAEALSSNDWINRDAFPGWFQNLESAIPRAALTVGADPFVQWLQTGLAGETLVGGLESEIGPGLAKTALKTKVAVVYPSDVASADVVFAPLQGGNGDLAKFATGANAAMAFARTGWRVAGQTRVDGVTTSPLPSGNGLPSGGTLDALQTLWKQQVGG